MTGRVLGRVAGAVVGRVVGAAVIMNAPGRCCGKVIVLPTWQAAAPQAICSRDFHWAWHEAQASFT